MKKKYFTNYLLLLEKLQPLKLHEMFQSDLLCPPPLEYIGMDYSKLVSYEILDLKLTWYWMNLKN